MSVSINISFKNYLKVRRQSFMNLHILKNIAQLFVERSLIMVRFSLCILGRNVIEVMLCLLSASYLESCDAHLSF